MAPKTPIFIAIIGVGGVGKAFLSQLDALRTRLAPSGTDIRLIYARRSTKHITSPKWEHLPIPSLVSTLDKEGTPPPPYNETFGQLASAPGKVVLVDNTSSLDIASLYPMVLQRGISVITPNKKGFSDSFALWERIYNAAANGSGAAGNGVVFHESSVGAGLPVLSSLKELVETGDKVTKIEGVFSGTMSFLFNSFQPVEGGGGSFAAEVSKAKDAGYTEPDARDDLNGLDVARKLTILARLVGLPIESPTSFPVQSLIPVELESCQSGDEFLEKLPQYDSKMEELKKSAESEGKVVRFVGSIDVGSKAVKVGPEKFDKSHPIAALKGSDNIINFYTERYGANPLIIQGAGAGGDVTAMGVTGDLLKVIRLVQ